ncbi:hypothetical protein GCM10010339_06510 [Streptomyces alanosinicus]|uniref:Uncharacterized protein n=1 Tax=Streptomyces alanosinicus TaxID=68171 RepID=A0A918YC55_9ACTN|nr:hypothetical protein GCM10010339_06510 [Streptomyces alanosinicus]
MTAVSVEISPRRPLPGEPPDDDLPYFTRPTGSDPTPVTAITAVADLDRIMDSTKCSCSAGDDNPH